MKKLTDGGKHYIKPTSVDKISAEERFGSNSQWFVERWLEPEPQVSPFMRAMGFHKHPSTCDHYRKRLYAGVKLWECMDCGIKL